MPVSAKRLAQSKLYYQANREKIQKKYLLKRKSILKQKKEARTKDPWKYRERDWKRQGIKCTQEDYRAASLKQQGLCAVCGISQDAVKRAFSVDHNHTTGTVRGLLCTNCNFHVVPLVEHKTQLLQKVRGYLGIDN
jgi:hypothetical protein